MFNIASDLNESGLEAGEVVQLQGEKYWILEEDDGLRIEPLRKQLLKKVNEKR